MRVAIIGRSQLLFETAELLVNSNFEIALIITAKETPEYSKTARDFELLATQIGAKYIYTPKINLHHYVEEIKKEGKIDLGISINYTGIISQEIIDLFPLGILNAHAGDLPRYRGNAPLAWAIINGEEKVGLCIHKMIGGELDSGNILVKEYLDISINTRIGELFNWIEERIPYLMLEAVYKLVQNFDYVGEVQSKNPHFALRGYPRLPEDGRIQWGKNAEDIVRLINASSEPFAGAYCEWKGKHLIIWRASLCIDEEQYSAVPGQIIPSISNDTVEIVCGIGKIRVLEIEFNGERFTEPKKVLKSVRYRLN